MRQTPLLLLLLASASLPAQTRLLRFPDCHGDQVVFTYGGDLWKAPLAGGLATHLTSATGVELFARFSPDGRWIAFTAQIDGDEQVFVMPSEGGQARQLTFYPARGPLPDRWGYDNQVYGWTPDGSAVLFRSLREAWTLTGCRLYTVALNPGDKARGALPVALPMPESGAGDFSPDGRSIVYSPLFRDFRTWKRYQGGWAQDLYVFDPDQKTAENITNDPRTDRDPMWIGDRIYFASDRTGTLNLWSYEPKTKKTYQETFSERWDVRWPSAGGPGQGRVVYEKGGELFWFDCKARAEHAIPIRVPDEALLRRGSEVDAKGLIEDYALSPGGRRAAFAARGEILTVPKEHGDVHDLTRSPGAHDKHPAFSPDGSKVAFVSDRSGEEQIYVVDHLGQTPPEQLTKELAVMLYTPVWSPDGKRLAFGDKDGVLRIVDLASKELVKVADEPHGQIDDQVWSPASDYLAFSMTGDNDLPGVYLYSLADKQLRRVSRPFADDVSPAFDSKGERLFFLGLRGYEPRLSTTYEWDFEIDRARGIYAIALQKDLPPLLAFRSDEAVEAKPKDDKPKDEVAPGDAAKAGTKQEEPPKTAAASPAAKAIDFDGIADRVEALPVPFDNYSGLVAVDGGLCYVSRGGPFYGRGPDRPAALHHFDFASRQSSELQSGIGGYALSPDGKQLLVRLGGRFVVMAASKTGKNDQKDLDLSHLTVERVPGDEWWQIFQEVWRRYRDFFYVANMHGYDWEALREQYAPLVAHVRDRSDLNYVLGEMVAELSIGHAYITGGDLDRPQRPGCALPGATFALDPDSGRYRIATLLRGQNDDPVYKAPLSELGLQIAVGDYVLAIDGVDLTVDVNPYRLLRRKQGQRVTFLVNQKPVREGAHTATFSPIGSEEKLHYLAWVEHNRAMVDQLSGGKLGYLHLPDMGAEGLREFVKQYYPQRDKDGLIIDDRYNGGGNVSSMVLNRLSRKLLLAGFGRTTGFDPYPKALFLGPMVCLLNESSASDGDMFPAAFRGAGLGKLIGKRSWGGVIGITNRGMLMDGGTVNVPEFGHTEPGDKWTIEGHGVDPDIVVDNDLASRLAGKDLQLERGVQELLQQLQQLPRPRPVPPPPPVKTGR